MPVNRYIDAQTTYKYCSACKVLKPLSAFTPYDHPRARSGHFWQCRKCITEKERAKRIAKRNAKQQADNDPNGWESAREAREIAKAWPALKR